MSTTITTNYAGDAAVEYISAALQSGATLAEENVTIHEGIKFKRNLRVAALTGILQADGCDFVDAGASTIDEVVLEPTKFKVNFEDCILPFEEDYEGEKMRAGRMNSEFPATFAEWLMTEIADQTSEEVEFNLWQGNVVGSTYTRFDGIEARIIALGARPTLNITSGGAVDASNAIAKMTEVYEAVPTKLLKKDGLKIWAASNVVRAYKLAMAALGYKDDYYAADVPLVFSGVEVLEAPGMTDNTIIAALKSDLHFGTDLSGDSEDVKMLDMREHDGSDNLRFISKMCGATQITNSDQIVLHHNLALTV